MSVTLSYMFRPAMTVQYLGKEHAELTGELVQHTLPRGRGFLEVDIVHLHSLPGVRGGCPINVIAIEMRRPAQRSSG